MGHPRIQIERDALTAAGLATGMTVLHVGPKGGPQAAWLSEQVGPSGHVVVVDGSPEELPAGDDSVDRVFLTGALERGPSVRTVGEEVRRVLRKGGRALLVDADAGLRGLYPFILEFEELARRLDDLRVENGMDPFAGRKLGWALRWADLKGVAAAPVTWTHKDVPVGRLMDDLRGACALLPPEEQETALAELKDHEAFLKDRTDAWATAGVWVASGQK